MSHPTVESWHALLEKRDASDLDAILADNVVFHSPVVHTPQEGKPLTKLYLTAALHVLVNDTFTYVREVVGEDGAALEFKTEIDGIQVNGVDLMHFDENGKIDDFKVMVRPLKAINLLHGMMKQMLESMS